MRLPSAILSCALALSSAALPSLASTDATACLEANFKVKLMGVEQDKHGSTLVYEASNALHWPVSATYLRIGFQGTRGYQLKASAFPVPGAPIASGETRVVRAKFWVSIPETVGVEQVKFDLVDVFDVDRAFLTGNGAAVHNWPNTQTKRGCRQ